MGLVMIIWHHCMKSVRIRNYSGPNFPAFGLNTKRYSVSLRIQSESGRMQTRITPNTDTFYAVHSSLRARSYCCFFMHGDHQDYPLAPELMQVTEKMLSIWQMGTFNAKNKFHSPPPKLMPNLRNKRHT